MTTQAPTPTPSKVALAKAQLEALQREAARRRLMPFIKRFNPKYHDGWVHNDVCRRLERFSKAVAEGKSPRLMILFPPRHGKSEIASRNFPPWHLGQYPDHEFIACSYNLSLAMDFSRKVKGILEDPLYHTVFDTRLDPNNQSTESWGVHRRRGGYVAAGIGGPITGKGANCLAGDTQIATTRGNIPVHALYRLNYVPEIVTPLGPRRALAITKRPAPQMYEVQLASGAVLRATGQHPIYVPDRAAYVSVEQLYGEAQSSSFSGVRVVREVVSAATVRPQQVVEKRVDRVLLQPGVQPSAPCSQKLEKVSDLLEAGYGDEKPQREVLFDSVHAASTPPRAEDLPSVQRGISAAAFEAGLLRGDLRQYGARNPYAWREELELADGQRIRVLVRPDEADDSGARQRVRSVYGDARPVLPPHRREPQQQRPGEFADAVPQAPHGAPQVCYDTISVVRCLGRSENDVYDLQVEEAGCFFADTILVGNCLVIDDPVKNAEEADSADTREKIWEWYLSTAYSRLAPGGGVLVIQCMTGDTPVLMADGSERRLDALAAGAEVATYDRGLLSSSRVAAVRSNGRDSVLKITTKSGKIVRANGRHPFLTTTDGGLNWTRARALTTAHKIVALPDRKGSGEVLPAPPTAVTSQLAAEGFAHPTTTSRSGPTGTARPASTQFPAETPTSNTGTASRSGNTTPSWRHKKGSALSAAVSPALHSPLTGKISSPLTTATTQARSGGSYVTAATQESDILELSPWHSPLPGISNFILDEIVSVEDDGVEEVFDLQVERTENFIANGLVTHNTHWHDDDLAGRLQTMMRDAAAGEGDYIDKFEVIKYPAIAEADEWLNHTTDLIEYDPPTEALAAPDAHYTLLRHRGDALHPERYDIDKLLRIKAQNKGGRWWSALYQQNPVPDDGSYFTKDQFRRAPLPSLKTSNVLIAWDFAISEKKQNDFTVGTVLLQDSDDMVHVADQVRFRSGDAFFIVEAILNLAQKWHNPSLVTGFEDGQIYRAIETLLKKRMRERQFYPPTMVLKPISDKMARGRALQGRMQQGMISFNASGEWYDTLRAEMLRFPAGAHDDQVDSLAWAVQMVVGREPPRKPAGEKIKSWKDKLQSGGVLSHMVA